MLAQLQAPAAAALPGIRSTPFVTGYLVVAWAVFLALAVVDFGGRRELADPFGFAIPRNAAELPTALFPLPAAPFVNAGVAQMGYVTVLLLVFGRLLERDVGSVGVAAAFLVATYGAALGATLALHGLEVAAPGSLEGVIDEAWERRWNGGSAGCYGVLGMVAARSGPRVLIVVAAVLAWEIALTAGHLRSFTPVFHLSAFATGFVVARALAMAHIGREATIRVGDSPARSAK